MQMFPDICIISYTPFIIDRLSNIARNLYIYTYILTKKESELKFDSYPLMFFLYSSAGVAFAFSYRRTLLLYLSILHIERGIYRFRYYEYSVYLCILPAKTLWQAGPGRPTTFSQRATVTSLMINTSVIG